MADQDQKKEPVRFWFYNGRGERIVEGADHELLPDDIAKILVPTLLIGGKLRGKPDPSAVKIPIVADKANRPIYTTKMEAGKITGKIINGDIEDLGGDSPRLQVVAPTHNAGHYLTIRSGFFLKPGTVFLDDYLDMQSRGITPGPHGWFAWASGAEAREMAASTSIPATSPEAILMFQHDADKIPMMDLIMYRLYQFFMPLDSVVIGRCAPGVVKRIACEKEGPRLVDATGYQQLVTDLLKAENEEVLKKAREVAKALNTAA